jgi:hypothetical protein
VHSLDRDVRFAAELSVGRVFTDCPLSSAITVGGVSPHTPGRGRTICENVIVPDEGSIEVICVPWRINRYLRFGLLVDGADHGSLRSGRRIEVHTVAGPHSVGITSVDRGTYEVDVDVPAGGKVNLACSADSVGLSAAQRSIITGVWDGPSPMALWLIDNEDWPDDPSPSGWSWWVTGMRNQDALAYSPQPVLRVFYWLTIKHYVIWWLLSTLGFAYLLSSSFALNTPLDFLSPLWALMIVLSAVVMIVRAIARHRPTMSEEFLPPEGQLHGD